MEVYGVGLVLQGWLHHFDVCVFFFERSFYVDSLLWKKSSWSFTLPLRIMVQMVASPIGSLPFKYSCFSAEPWLWEKEYPPENWHIPIQGIFEDDFFFPRWDMASFFGGYSVFNKNISSSIGTTWFHGRRLLMVIPDPVPPTSVGAKTPGILNRWINYSNELFLKHHFDTHLGKGFVYGLLWLLWRHGLSQSDDGDLGTEIFRAGSPEAMMVSKLGISIIFPALIFRWTSC